MLGLEPLQQLENFFGMIIFQFVGCTPAGMEFDFMVIVPLLLSPCGLSFVSGCGICFFGGLQHSPADGYSAASCDLVFPQEKMGTFPSSCCCHYCRFDIVGYSLGLNTM